jgi:stearoyl-CoA desaturase (delta-9 desaturase)
MVNFLVDNLHGLADLSLWGYVGITFLFIQISMMAVTLYLHRDQAHRAIELHPVLRHFFRFWIWATSGMVTSEWVSIHRKHHALCERKGDPHSPRVFGLRKVLLEGAELYRAEAKNPETVEKYGRGTPDDWIERKLYAKYSLVGIYTMLILDVILFGALGITMFALQMMAMPVFAAGVINGLGHAKGYRNFECDDAATNLTPIAVLVGGEELHNNHHAFPTSAKFSVRRWEFDIGWLYISIFKALRLCAVRRVAPTPNHAIAPRVVDIDTLKAVLQNRMHVLRDYTRQVTLPVLRMEKQARGRDKKLRRARRLLVPRPTLLGEASRDRLTQLLDDNTALKTVYEFREQLVALWEQANVSNDRLVKQLKEWCVRAEESGIRVLQEFSASLRGYLPQTT